MRHQYIVAFIVRVSDVMVRVVMVWCCSPEAVTNRLGSSFFSALLEYGLLL